MALKRAVDRAHEVMQAYDPRRAAATAREYDEDSEAREAFDDLLADLLHLAAYNELDVDRAVERALQNYKEEKDGEECSGNGAH